MAGTYLVIIFQKRFSSAETKKIQIHYREVEGGIALWRQLPALIFLTESKVTADERSSVSSP